MSVETKQVFVTKIEEDLAMGMSWLKRDDAGYGSIQEKYNASDIHIATIRKHPLLKNLEPSLVIFEVIDDTHERNTTTISATNGSNDSSLGNTPATTKQSDDKSSSEGKDEKTLSRSIESGVREIPTVTTTESADAEAFFNI